MQLPLFCCFFVLFFSGISYVFGYYLFKAEYLSQDPVQKHKHFKNLIFGQEASKNWLLMGGHSSLNIVESVVGLSLAFPFPLHFTHSHPVAMTPIPSINTCGICEATSSVGWRTESLMWFLATGELIKDQSTAFSWLESYWFSSVWRQSHIKDFLWIISPCTLHGVHLLQTSD